MTVLEKRATESKTKVKFVESKLAKKQENQEEDTKCYNCSENFPNKMELNQHNRFFMLRIGAFIVHHVGLSVQRNL